MLGDEQRLYLMRNSAGMFKVGISKDPDRRRREIELASGMPTSIIKCWITEDATAHTVEQALHSLYARRRMHGEWFEYMTINDIRFAGYELRECNHDGTERRREHEPD